MSGHVNVDNFVRAETHRMFADIQLAAGGVGKFRHNREPASIDEQTVIRLNRDTLYSFAVVDLAEPAVLTLPDAGERYVSAMIVNENHYVGGVLHAAGEHTLTQEQYGSRYVLVAVRILVDPTDADDVATVGVLQDQTTVTSGSSESFVSPDYDTASLDATRNALLELAKGLDSFDRTFGTREEVDPVRHLIGCAAGWGGGLPTSEATYVASTPPPPAPPGTTNSSSPMSRSTPSGRCRSTTRPGSSSRTRRTSTRSTASPVYATTTVRSPCGSSPPTPVVTSRPTRS